MERSRIEVIDKLLIYYQQAMSIDDYDKMYHFLDGHGMTFGLCAAFKALEYDDRYIWYDIIEKHAKEFFKNNLPDAAHYWPIPTGVYPFQTIIDLKKTSLRPRIDFLISLQTKLNLNGPAARLKKFFDFINIFKL